MSRKYCALFREWGQAFLVVVAVAAAAVVVSKDILSTDLIFLL